MQTGAENLASLAEQQDRVRQEAAELSRRRETKFVEHVFVLQQPAGGQPEPLGIRLGIMDADHQRSWFVRDLIELLLVERPP